MRNISLQSIEKNPYLDSIIQITSGKNMITDGPLSLQYTQALNEIYKKDTDTDTGISLETQANDAIVSKSLWVAANDTRTQLADSGQEVGMLYGVKQNDVGMSTVIEVTDAIGQMTDSERENSAIVMEKDYTEMPVYPIAQVTPEDSVETNPFADTVRNIAQDNNVDVFYSLEAYVESNKMPDGTYSGTISGKKVKFKIGKKTHKFTNDEGVKGTDIPCEIVVKKNDVYQINIAKQK